MSRRAAVSARAEREQVRDRMRAAGCAIPQIAAEMARRFNLRPRVAWRHALGWPQWKLAQEYNATHLGARLSDNRISEYETWPHGGVAPSLRYLTNLASTYGHGCTAAQLVDLDDLDDLDEADRRLIIDSAGAGLALPQRSTPRPDDRVNQLAITPMTDTVEVGSIRRTSRVMSGTQPSREEVAVAAEESARFTRWSALAVVDDEALDQMDADVGDVARRYLVDPPALIFAHLVRARDDVFGLITQSRQPRLTQRLYRIAGQVCAILAHASADFGAGHAANTQARTALRCADLAGDPAVHGYVRWVQSNVAYWNGRHDDAAELVEAAIRAPPSGTGLLRLASQLARIEASRRRPDAVKRALAIAERAPNDVRPEEPGVFGFTTGKAAYYASEAHRDLGGADHLEAAVRWAAIAVDEFTAERTPSTPLVAAARFDLSWAYLVAGNVDDATGHLTPTLQATEAQHRTVPVISRARSLQAAMARFFATAADARGLHDELAQFCLAPAAAPAALTASPEH